MFDLTNTIAAAIAVRVYRCATPCAHFSFLFEFHQSMQIYRCARQTKYHNSMQPFFLLETLNHAVKQNQLSRQYPKLVRPQFSLSAILFLWSGEQTPSIVSCTLWILITQLTHFVREESEINSRNQSSRPNLCWPIFCGQITPILLLSFFFFLVVFFLILYSFYLDRQCCVVQRKHVCSCCLYVSKCLYFILPIRDSI